MEKPLTRNIDVGCGSEASTLKGIIRKAESSDSVRTYVKAQSVAQHLRHWRSIYRAIFRFSYDNSATSFENGLKSDSDDDDFDVDEGGGGDMEQQVRKPSIRRVCKIDESPEAVQKREEVFKNWLQSVE